MEVDKLLIEKQNSKENFEAMKSKFEKNYTDLCDGVIWKVISSYHRLGPLFIDDDDEEEIFDNVQSHIRKRAYGDLAKLMTAARLFFELFALSLKE